MTPFTSATTNVRDSMLGHAEHGLDARARTVAAWLELQGPVGSRVIIACPEGADNTVAFLGALYAGWVPVSAPAPTSARRAERMGAIAATADALVAFTARTMVETAMRATPGLPWMAVDVLEVDDVVPIQRISARLGGMGAEPGALLVA